MLNNIPYRKFKILVSTFIICLFYSCEEENKIAFSEINILEENATVVEINIPKAEGSDVICKRINFALTSFVNNTLRIDSNQRINDSLQNNIRQFNDSYLKFQNELTEELKLEITPWEASIEGEVIYQSNNLICIAMNEYINTGGIHGALKVSFMNFDAKTGNQLDYNDFINDKEKLKKFLKSYFEKEVGSISNDDFKLPETIGISDEGVIILYNINEIPSYTDNLTEFTVPFNEVESFLKIY